jgi:hypothetical protein
VLAQPNTLDRVLTFRLKLFCVSGDPAQGNHSSHSLEIAAVFPRFDGDYHGVEFPSTTKPDGALLASCVELHSMKAFVLGADVAARHTEFFTDLRRQHA